MRGTKVDKGVGKQAFCGRPLWVTPGIIIKIGEAYY